MTVREINRHTMTGKPLIALYVMEGTVQQGRIIRARQRWGRLEVKSLNTGQWYPVTQNTQHAGWTTK